MSKTKSQTIQARINEKTHKALLELSCESKEVQSETIRKALAFYLEAMSDADNKILIVNNTKKTEREVYFV